MRFNIMKAPEMYICNRTLLQPVVYSHCYLMSRNKIYPLNTDGDFFAHYVIVELKNILFNELLQYPCSMFSLSFARVFFHLTSLLLMIHLC